MNNEMISNDKEEKNEIKEIPPYTEEIPINDRLFNSEDKVIQTPQTQNGKNVKFCPNNISVIPISQSYNLRYASNTNTYNGLNDNIKDIINDPKYNNSENRSKSAYSKKSFREKFESMKLKVPEVKNWNCDPTAEIIIHNLEQKIDILTYENFLLTKKIKELVNNNNSLQLDLNHKILLLRTEQQINEENLKNSQNNNISDLNSNLYNKKDTKKDKNKKSNKDKEKEKDVDLYNELKDENEKLKKSNENLAENNMKLNKLIDELKKEIKFNQEKYEEELEKNKILYEKELKEQNEQNENNKLMLEQKLLEQNDYYKKILEKKLSGQNENAPNNINNINTDNDNIKNENENENDNNNDNVKIEENNDSSFDMNKNILSEEKLKKLVEENEKLHKELRVLLGIDDDEDYNYSSIFKDNQNFIFSPIQQSNKKQSKFTEIQKETKNVDINNNNAQYSEDILKENYFLKQKVKSLTTELNKVLTEQNQKLIKIQKKFNEYELKNKNNSTVEKTNNEFNEMMDKSKEEEIDKILNDTLILNINLEDEETKKMISTIENIKNKQQKRISKCLVIYNKLKSLSEENCLLHNQMSSKKKEKENIINMNDNLSDNNLHLNSTTKPHLCYGTNGCHESYDYLINALKIKDEIIMKYKEKSEDNENKYKQLIIENSKLKESNEREENNNSYNGVNGNVNYVKKEVKINTMRRNRAGLEDYLLDKIVNNQKEVLGERAPRFDEDNCYQYMSKSMINERDNHNRMNNRHSNNYHYREKRMTNY